MVKNRLKIIRPVQRELDDQSKIRACMKSASISAL